MCPLPQRGRLPVNLRLACSKSCFHTVCKTFATRSSYWIHTRLWLQKPDSIRPLQGVVVSLFRHWASVPCHRGCAGPGGPPSSGLLIGSPSCCGGPDFCAGTPRSSFLLSSSGFGCVFMRVPPSVPGNAAPKMRMLPTSHSCLERDD